MYPYPLNRGFIGAAHTTEDIDRMLDVMLEFVTSHKDQINNITVEDASVSR